MLQYQPFSPVDIRFTTPSAFGEELSSLAGSRVLVVASEGTLRRMKEWKSLNRLVGDGTSRLISDIRANPSVDDVRGVLNMLRNEEPYGTILAIGGGSSIDLAKAISALQGLADRDPDYGEIVTAIAQKSFFEGAPPADIIAVPTTAGTGSEVTRWATIWDFRNGRKLSVEHPGCFPKAAVMIPELTRSMPPRLTLATGLDALSHAMEAFWAKARNPLSQALALDSIARIKRALPIALEDGDDVRARQEMSLGSLLAGLAFSTTKTTACHSMSYPLTLHHNVEHGFAAALTLSALMEINAEAVPEMAEVVEVFGSAEGFNAWLCEVTQGIQELRLSAFGVRGDTIDAIAEGAFTLGRMDNNPVALTQDSVEAILKCII